MSNKKQKAIFLDRNDTLTDDAASDAASGSIRLLPGATEALVQFKKMGYFLVVLADKPSGEQSQGTDSHYHLKSLLAGEGAAINGVYDWPKHPDSAVKDFSMETNLQQSDSNVLELAAGELDIDLKASWMIGDLYRDIKAGKSAGCQTILVDVPGHTREQKSDDPDPDRKAVNLREAVNIVRMYEFHQKAKAVKKTQQQPQPAQVAAPVQEISEPAPKPQPAPAKTPVQSAPKKVVQPPQPPAQKTVADTPAKIAQPAKKFHTAKKTPKAKEQPPAVAEHADKTHHLLEEVLQRLKSHSRTEMYDDFSVFKLLAIMVQVITLACVAFSLAAWMSREPNYAKVQILIAYAVFLQLLVISLLIMHRRD
ncbi:MAG: HAD-IIIA family hydrolase [Planctomycetota bacterium]|jgi:HAD superfamily hydrolase (TIGR01662 family)